MSDGCKDDKKKCLHNTMHDYYVCAVLQRQHYPIKTILKPKIGQQTAYYVHQPN